MSLNKNKSHLSPVRIQEQTPQYRTESVIAGCLIPLARDIRSWYIPSHAGHLPKTHFSGAGAHRM